eukprot:jgi/Chlat1/2241/Chrsp17S02559
MALRRRLLAVAAQAATSSFGSVAAVAAPAAAPLSRVAALQAQAAAAVAPALNVRRPYATTAAAQDPLPPQHRNVMILENRVPLVAPDAWIAPNATVVGDVDVYDRSTIWYGAVLRGDLNHIHVGGFSSILERVMVHAAESNPTGLSAATSIGNYVTIGARSVLRSVDIGNEVIVGAGSIVMEGVIIESQSVLAAGTVVPPGRLIPSGQLWAGNPARYVRDLTYDEKAEIIDIAESLSRVAVQHWSEFLPYSFAYIQAEALRKALAPMA